MKKLSIHPISVIIWLWLYLVLGLKNAFAYVLAITIHEFGHYIVAKKLGYKLEKFSFSPYGISLNYSNLDYRDEILIASAGPLANFITSFLMLSVWWIFPEAYFLTDSFVITSLLLALINLLPAYPMDGGRIFIGLSSKVFHEKTAKKITIFANILFSVLFLILFVIFMFINFNPTLLLFSIFMIVGVLDLNFETKYQKINVFCKKNKNFSKINTIFVNDDTTLQEILSHMENSKTQLFCLVLQNGRVVDLSEKMLINLSTTFPLATTLKEIFEK